MIVGLIFVYVGLWFMVSDYDKEVERANYEEKNAERARAAAWESKAARDAAEEALAKMAEERQRGGLVRPKAKGMNS